MKDKLFIKIFNVVPWKAVITLIIVVMLENYYLGNYRYIHTRHSQAKLKIIYVLKCQVVAKYTIYKI